MITELLKKMEKKGVQRDMKWRFPNGDFQKADIVVHRYVRNHSKADYQSVVLKYFKLQSADHFVTSAMTLNYMPAKPTMSAMTIKYTFQRNVDLSLQADQMVNFLNESKHKILRLNRHVRKYSKLQNAD